jgi:hypothetical protein
MGCTGSKRKDHHDRPDHTSTTRAPAQKSSSFFSIKDKYQTLEGTYKELSMLVGFERQGEDETIKREEKTDTEKGDRGLVLTMLYTM